MQLDPELEKELQMEVDAALEQVREMHESGCLCQPCIDKVNEDWDRRDAKIQKEIDDCPECVADHTDEPNPL